MLANKIGIMQGRLVPKYKGRYQAHPVGYWADEFPICADLGLEYIEFIFDYNDYEINPLYSIDGIDNIRRLSEKTHVSVRSVCADYFMEAPLHSSEAPIAAKSISVMKTLIRNVSALGVTDVVLPCVDQSSLKGEEAIQRFLKNLQPVIEMAEQHAVNISLETDLDPVLFSQLLANFPSRHVTVNYDSGNSASLGYNPIEEFSAYGSRISDIHIKDRVKDGGSVKLGTGDLDFNQFFAALHSINFQGPLIMQVYRDEEGVSVFKEQLSFFKEKIQNSVR